MYKNRKQEDAGERYSSLYAELAGYCGSDHYPYHMPGHKRNPEAGEMARYYGIDITEIDGFDDLHHAGGILLEAQRRANRLYGKEDTETFYLVNGSTGGVLASLLAATDRGGEALAARNCHKSVYHAAILQGLRLHYYEPPVLAEYGICGGVSAEGIACLLDEFPACSAVVITSPTYEGILSDVGAVADAVHARGRILIVDEAHGAHLGLHESMPQGAFSQGADLVVHSLHKTLPAMTQTALLHVQGERVDRRKLRRYLTMLQTSSPSYVLMASMDSCIRYLEEQGAARFVFMRRQYDVFCKKMKKCRYIEIGNIVCTKKKAAEKYDMAGWDIGKLVIRVRDGILDGRQLYDLLREEYHLQMEMAAEGYVLAIMTIMDTAEGWQRLADALQQIDGRIEAGQIGVCGGRKNGRIREEEGSCSLPPVEETAEQAFLGAWEEVGLMEAAGRVAADFINLYPPGIPLAVPGETIGEALLLQIRRSMDMGLTVQGVTPEKKVAVRISAGPR